MVYGIKVFQMEILFGTIAIHAHALHYFRSFNPFIQPSSITLCATIPKICSYNYLICHN